MGSDHGVLLALFFLTFFFPSSPPPNLIFFFPHIFYFLHHLFFVESLYLKEVACGCSSYPPQFFFRPDSNSQIMSSRIFFLSDPSLELE